jgi:hypothetical protein
MPIDNEGSHPADQGAERGTHERDERRFEHDHGDHRRPRDAHESERGNVSSALIDFEQQDAEQEDGARDNRDDADSGVEAPEHAKRFRRAHRDLGRRIRAKSERDVIDPLQGATRIRALDREPAHAVAGAEQPLQIAEMEAHAIGVASDLTGVGATACDGADDEGVAAHAGFGRENDAVADAEVRGGR